MDIDLRELKQSIRYIESKRELFAATFFKTLLEDYPALQPFFACSDMQRLQDMVVNSLTLVIDNWKQSNRTLHFVDSLAKFHSNLGVEAIHFTWFRNAIMSTLKSMYEEDDWTSRLEQAWQQFFEMITGYLQHPETIRFKDMKAGDMVQAGIVATVAPAAEVPEAPPEEAEAQAPAPAEAPEPEEAAAPVQTPAAEDPENPPAPPEAHPPEGPEQVSESTNSGASVHPIEEHPRRSQESGVDLASQVTGQMVLPEALRQRIREMVKEHLQQLVAAEVAAALQELTDQWDDEALREHIMNPTAKSG